MRYSFLFTFLKKKFSFCECHFLTFPLLRSVFVFALAGLLMTSCGDLQRSIKASPYTQVPS